MEGAPYNVFWNHILCVQRIKVITAIGKQILNLIYCWQEELEIFLKTSLYWISWIMVFLYLIVCNVKVSFKFIQNTGISGMQVNHLRPP